MYEGLTVGVVVPCFNEAKNVTNVIEKIPDYVDRIYIVDDVSTDNTVEVVRRCIESTARPVILLTHMVNQGPGGAITTGYKQALIDEIDAVVVMAGDDQMDPDNMPALLAPIVKGEADYVKGNRYLDRKAWENIPKMRFFGNAALSMLTKIASGYWHIIDSQTGYTAIRKQALQRLPLDVLWKRYGYPNHMLVMLNIHNCVVRDVPVRAVYHENAVSGIRVGRLIPHLSLLLFKWFLWRMWEKYVLRDFHPLVLFYLLSWFMFIISMVLGTRLAILWYYNGIIPQINALGALIAFTNCIQAAFFAMWFDMDYNKHLR
ncbi:MAG TPA: glycosyltransferase family 2 protein [Aggregatilineales bacterium]|nr:glycosyltransferase family 2 protein [Aggregatilineales bacterium]